MQMSSNSTKPSLGVISNSGYSSLNYISGALTPTRTTIKKRQAKVPRVGLSPRKVKKKDFYASVRTNSCLEEEGEGKGAKQLLLSTLQHSEIRQIIREVVETPQYLKKYVDYSCKMEAIVKIQSWFRGFLVRKRKRWLDFAHYCASTVQRHWKGFKQRKFYLFYQLRKYAAIAIQRKYRLHYYRRVKAARKIQHCFLKHLEERLLPLETHQLDAEIERYEKMTKEVLGDVLHTEKAKRRHLFNSISPNKKKLIEARMLGQDLEGLD